MRLYSGGYLGVTRPQIGEFFAGPSRKKGRGWWNVAIQHYWINCPTNMPGQASMWRIYFRYHINIFPSARRSSISRCGRSLWLSSCHEGQLTIRGVTISPQYRAFSSKGLRTDEESTKRTVPHERPIPGSQKTEDAGKPEESQRTISIAKSIANLDAISFLASAGLREKKFVGTKPEDPLLAPNADKADQQFLKNYNLLLSDTNYGLEMELETLEESKWATGDSKHSPVGFKRMPVTRNNKSVGQIIA